MKKLIVKILVLTAVTTAAWAHGENKPGPHGGVIRMPGAFHTELKQTGARSVELFLLDMEWKNPIVENSGAKATFKKSDGTEVALSCITKAKSFKCELPKGSRFEKGGKVTIQASRSGMHGGLAEYQYPFKPGNPSMKGQHHGH